MSSRYQVRSYTTSGVLTGYRVIDTEHARSESGIVQTFVGDCHAHDGYGSMSDASTAARELADKLNGYKESEHHDSDAPKAKHRIENPRIEFRGESADHFDASACFELDGARFHIWLNAATGELQHGVGTTLYKNPPLGTAYKARGYFETRQLDSSAKVNAPLIAELFERVNFDKAREEFLAELKRKRDKREEEQRAQAETARLQSYFTATQDVLESLEADYAYTGSTCETRDGRDSAARELALLDAILKYRFPDAC
jgi:hypothetical protein